MIGLYFVPLKLCSFKGRFFSFDRFIDVFFIYQIFFCKLLDNYKFSFMKINFRLRVFCFASLLTIASCQKKDYNSAGTHSPSIANLRANMKELNDALKSVPQVFTVSAGTNQVIRCSEGTKIGFNPTSFKDRNGNIITNGVVTVKVVEMYNSGAMAANHASTATVDGHFLQSGGQITISATMGEMELIANRYSVSFKKPESTANTMFLYYGNRNNADSAVRWEMAQLSDSLGKMCIGDFTDTAYVFDSCSSFGYVNCDRLPTSAGSTKMYVVVPDASYDVENTGMFLILPTLNSYIENRIGEYNYSTHTFLFGDDGSELPIGLEYKLLLVSHKGDKYYYAEKSGTTTAADVIVNVIPTEQTEAYVKDKIKGL